MRHICTYIALLITASLFAQQQPLYTQFMYNKQIYNPAYVAIEKVSTLGLVYRNQWVGLEGAPTSMGLSFSKPFNSQNASFGLNLKSSAVGLSKEILIDGLYAYKFDVGIGTLSLGLQVSLKNFAIDFNSPNVVTTSDVLLDPSLDGPRTSRNFNFGLGAYWRTDNVYFGLSVPRVQNIDIDKNDSFNFSKEERHIYAMLGAHYKINESFSIKPQMLLKWIQTTPKDLDLNVSVVYLDKYTAGVTLRMGGDSDSFGESLDAIFGIQLNERFLFGFAYDYTLSKIRQRSSGSVEVIGHYRFQESGSKATYINPRYF